MVAVAESDQKRVSAHASLLEGLTVVSDYHQLLRPGAIDGVLVCSANSRHKQVVLDFARAKDSDSVREAHCDQVRRCAGDVGHL